MGLTYHLASSVAHVSSPTGKDILLKNDSPLQGVMLLLSTSTTSLFTGLSRDRRRSSSWAHTGKSAGFDELQASCRSSFAFVLLPSKLRSGRLVANSRWAGVLGLLLAARFSSD